MKQRVLATGHLCREQRTEDVVVEREHGVTEAFTLSGRVRLCVVDSYVEEIKSDRPFNVFGVDRDELAVEGLSGRKHLQALDRLDEVAVALHDDNGRLIGGHKLKVTQNEVLEQSRFAGSRRRN